MKFRKSNFPRSLACLPNLDFFQPDGSDDPTGGTSTASYFDSVDFKMYSGSASCPGCEIDYTEVHMDGAAAGSSNPIKNEDSPEKVLLLMGLPKPGAEWTMTLKLDGPNGMDEVEMASIDGDFQAVYDDVSANYSIIYEEAGLFFTFERTTGNFETYVNINQAGELVKLKHSLANVFDDFSVSFLARSNTAG